MPACISFSALFPCISKKKQDQKLKGHQRLPEDQIDCAQFDSKKKSVTFKKDASVAANDKDAQELYSEQRDVLYRLRGDIGVLGTSSSHSPSEDNKSDGEDLPSAKLASTTVDLRPSPPHLSFEPRSSPHTIFSGQSSSPHSSSTSMFAPGGPCDSPVLSPATGQRLQNSDATNCGSIEWYNEQEKGNHHTAIDNSSVSISTVAGSDALDQRTSHDPAHLGSEKASSVTDHIQRRSVDPSRLPSRSLSSSMGPAPIPSKQVPSASTASEKRFSTPPQPASAGARRLSASVTSVAPSAAIGSPAVSVASVAAASVAAAAVSGKRALSPSVPTQPPQPAAVHRPAADVPISSVQSWMQLDPSAPVAVNAGTVGKGARYTAPPPRSQPSSVAPAVAAQNRAEARGQALVRDTDDRCKVRQHRSRSRRRLHPLFFMFRVGCMKGINVFVLCNLRCGVSYSRICR